MSAIEKTCAERISEHLEGRTRDFAALRDLSQVSDHDELATLLEDAASRALFGELAEQVTPMWEGDAAAVILDELREAAETRMDELPLGVQSSTVFRIDLSTGGPGDWLEVHCTGDTPLWRPLEGDGAEYFEVDRIVYHFNDWFDHAERQLDGFEFEAAEHFAMRVVPELVG